MRVLPFALGLFGWMALRALLNGASVGDVLAYGGFLAAYVVLPGWLVYRLLRGPEDDGLAALGMGWALGHAIQLGSYLALKAASAAWLYPYFPLLLLPLAAVALRRKLPRSECAPLGAGPAMLLLGILALAVARAPILPEWWLAGDPDFLFHVGNAAELRHHWPLSDPRLAGEALNYHFFSYALPAGASQVIGIPVAALMQRLVASTLPALLGLQVFNAGRAYGGSVAAGLLAALLVVLQADAASVVLPRLGLQKFSGGFNNHLDLAIYGSLSSALGLALFASLAIALRRWLLSDPPDTRALGLAAALAAAASGAKGSVMPVVLAALGGLALWAWLVRRARPARTLVAAGALGVVAAPMTLQLALGPGSFASAMLSIGPFQALLSSAFYQELALRLGAAPGGERAGLAVLLAPLWLLGFLGFAGLAGLIFLLRQRQRLDAAQRWLAWVLVVGLVLALGLEAPGHSQLFFVYNAQLALAWLAGAWLASQGRPRTPRQLAVGLPLLVLALPGLWGGGQDAAGRLAGDLTFRPRAALLEAEYARGLRWIRETTAPNDLFVTQHGFILLSALAERRVFYETDYFAAAAHASRPPGDRYGLRRRKQASEPFAARQLAFLEFLAAPERDAVQTLRTFAPDAGAIYLVIDDVQGLMGRGWGHFRARELPRSDRFGAHPLLTPVFGNRALRIYRVEDREPSAGCPAPRDAAAEAA